MVEDRALLVALLDAVGALAKRLTGETMLVCVKDSSGGYVHLYQDQGVTWFREDEVDAAPAGRLDRCSNPRHAWPDATRQAPE